MSEFIAAALDRWFRRHARDLPWRRRRTGYTGLVAETMLQQTQVARVEERFGAFVRRFPTVRSLAAADEQEVLTLWQGLGYYQRARHLQAAARTIAEVHRGRVPTTVAALRRLPGVGRYTAGAIASIVYGRCEPIVDGNVQRVLSRLEARAGAVPAPGADAWSWERARRLAEAAERPGVVNEAIMELGATVCTPKAPRCGACPLARRCEARRRGRAETIPPPKPAARRRVVHHHAVVVTRTGRILLERRAATGLWADLWQPPTVEATRRLPAPLVAARLAMPVTDIRRVGSFEHLTTHRRVRFHVFTAHTRARRGVWRHPDKTSDLPMSNAHRRILELV